MMRRDIFLGKIQVITIAVIDANACTILDRAIMMSVESGSRWRTGTGRRSLGGMVCCC